MIAEPYICIDPKETDRKLGEIVWDYPHNLGDVLGFVALYRAYADFEREKLWKEFGVQFVRIDNVRGFFLPWMVGFNSKDLINYDTQNYIDDSESSRLLKRAEFLKAVCEKEGVEWLPKEETHAFDVDSLTDPKNWQHSKDCDCHKTKKCPKEWYGGDIVVDTIKCKECGIADRDGGIFCASCRSTIENRVMKNCNHIGGVVSEINGDWECKKCGYHSFCEECMEQCKLIVQSTYGKNVIDKLFDNYYTKAEIDHKIVEAKNELLHNWQVEERGWRKAVCDLLMEIVTNTTSGLKFQGSKWLVEDIRSRFLPPTE